MKIGVKLVLIIGVLMLIGVVLSGTTYYYTGMQSIEERIMAQLESIVVLKENQFDMFIEEEKEDLKSAAREKFFLSAYIDMQRANASEDETIYKENLRELLKERLMNDKNILGFFVLNKNGEIDVSSDNEQEGKIKSDKLYFIEGKKETFVHSFYYDLTLQKPAMTISTPIKDTEGKVLGVLAGRIDLDEISRLMTERSGLGETGETYLVNKFNFVVTELLKEEGAVLKKTIHTEAVKDCLKKNSGNGLYKDYKDVPVLVSYAWLQEREVCLLAQIDEEEAIMSIYTLRSTIIITSAVLLVFIVMLGFFFSKPITSSIRKLNAAAVGIGKGELDVEIQIETKDELGMLAKTFNQMATDLKESRREIESYNKELEEKVHDRTKALESKNVDLEKFNKLAINRELRMVDLKKRIRELEEGRKE